MLPADPVFLSPCFFIWQCNSRESSRGLMGDFHFTTGYLIPEFFCLVMTHPLKALRDILYTLTTAIIYCDIKVIKHSDRHLFEVCFSSLCWQKNAVLGAVTLLLVYMGFFFLKKKMKPGCLSSIYAQASILFVIDYYDRFVQMYRYLLVFIKFTNIYVCQPYNLAGHELQQLVWPKCMK